MFFSLLNNENTLKIQNIGYKQKSIKSDEKHYKKCSVSIFPISNYSGVFIMILKSYEPENLKGLSTASWSQFFNEYPTISNNVKQYPAISDNL